MEYHYEVPTDPSKEEHGSRVWRGIPGVGSGGYGIGLARPAPTPSSFVTPKLRLRDCLTRDTDPTPAGYLSGVGPSVPAGDPYSSLDHPSRELIETEEVYVDQLRGIVKEVAGAWSKTNVPPKKLDAVFLSIEGIYKANRSLLKRLKNALLIYNSTPGALAEILVRCQIEDLEDPYSKYCSTFCTGFDACEPVKWNPRLPDILAAFSVSHPLPMWAHSKTGWTLDTLFLLPRVRLRYYRRLYLQRLFSYPTPSDSGIDRRLLASAFEKFYRFISILEAREKLKVADLEILEDEANPTVLGSAGSLSFPPVASSPPAPLNSLQDSEPMERRPSDASFRAAITPSIATMQKAAVARIYFEQFYFPLLRRSEPPPPRFQRGMTRDEQARGLETPEISPSETSDESDSSDPDWDLFRPIRWNPDTVVDARQAFPFSQYPSDSQLSIREDLISVAVESDDESPKEQGVDTRNIIERLNKLFHDDKEWYTRFLACRGASAQWLLDLLQDLLDYDADCAPTDRRRLFKALLRLSADSELYPRCFTLIDLEHERLVAGGSFSDVYMGYLRGQCVAVKMMRVFDESDIDAVLKGFGREAIIWRQLSHPNLLPFFGLYKFRQRLCLVSPWMENGHIRGFLKKQMCESDRLLSLILDVALGLEHLHTMGVVHGDLKADNIFITSSGRACIADFGLSSITSSMSSIQFTHSSKASRGGTARYQAPELHRGGHNDCRSDIYGFACVVYELLAGNAPFPELPSDMAVMFAVLEGRRPSCPPSCSGMPALDGLWTLLQDCWHGEPDRRPTAGRVVERLKGGDIGASESSMRSEKDWDSTSTSKFRRRLLGQQTLPTMVEFENVFGTEKLVVDVKPNPQFLELAVDDAISVFTEPSHRRLSNCRTEANSWKQYSITPSHADYDQ